MKVILLKDIPNVGHKYEVKEVANGYARNKLIPSGWAELATPEREQALEAKRLVEEQMHEERLAKLREEFGEIAAEAIVLKASANDEGHLYAQIHAEDIADALEHERGASIDASTISIPDPIKELGKHTVKVSLGDEEKELSVVVEKE